MFRENWVLIFFFQNREGKLVKPKGNIETAERFVVGVVTFFFFFFFSHCSPELLLLPLLLSP